MRVANNANITKILKQKNFSNKEYFFLNSILFKIVSISEIHLAHFEREEKDKREKRIKRIKRDNFPDDKNPFFSPFISTED